MDRFGVLSLMGADPNLLSQALRLTRDVLVELDQLALRVLHVQGFLLQMSGQFE